MRNRIAGRTTTLAARLRPRLGRFGHDENGALVIFALMLAVLMLMMGGIAVDLMRYESRRTSLQNTLDRSTLAAAAMTQDLDPESVVNDYFRKAGLMEYLTSVTVTQGLNFRNVSATAAADTTPMFLPIMDISQFDAKGASAAEQRIGNVEIMLILDVSGSMASNNRLVNLKAAANEFVQTILANDVEKKISIGIVPFNGQVNLGATLISRFNTVDPSGATNVNCIDLPTTAYDTATISQYAWATSVAPTALSMTANADTGSPGWTDPPNDGNRWCPPVPGNVVRLPSQDIATLQGYINGLTAIGATSINAGMKWGLGLLDPSSRNIYTSLINGGAMAGNLSGRPFDYDDDESMKVIVLMTDGEHHAEQRVQPAYKSGLSPIYRSNTDGNYSIFHGSVSQANKFYVPHLRTWQATPWTSSSGTGTAAQQTWPQVWANVRLQTVALYYYAWPLSFGDGIARNIINANMVAAMRAQTPTTTMDTQLQSVCTLAKQNRVIVYGIAFEAPTNGQTQIRDCSTDGATGAYYFNASGLQISTAFRAIANNISQLRLTQ